MTMFLYNAIVQKHSFVICGARHFIICLEVGSRVRLICTFWDIVCFDHIHPGSVPAIDRDSLSGFSMQALFDYFLPDICHFLMFFAYFAQSQGVLQ